MYLKKDLVEQKERQEKSSSTRMWKTKLWSGAWDAFIKQTDEKFTKSSPLVSRLEMLKNAVDYGYPSLALKLYQSRADINGPTSSAPKNIRHLQTYMGYMEANSEDQFLSEAFGSPHEVLHERKITDKGEHLLYLLRVHAENADVEDFLEKRIIRLIMNEYRDAIKKQDSEIEPDLSFEDYISLTQVCTWHEKNETVKDTVEMIQNILIELWFRKFNKDVLYLKQKNRTLKGGEAGDLRSMISLYEAKSPYPALKTSEIKDEEKLESLFDELRDALDHFSYMIGKSRKNIYMDEVQDYVYCRKVSNGDITYFHPKKEFRVESVYKKQEVVNRLYETFHEYMERMEDYCPV